MLSQDLSYTTTVVDWRRLLVLRRIIMKCSQIVSLLKVLAPGCFINSTFEASVDAMPFEVVLSMNAAVVASFFASQAAVKRRLPTLLRYSSCRDGSYRF